MVMVSPQFGYRAAGLRGYLIGMQEDDRTDPQSEAWSARELLLRMARCYLAELGTERDLEMRSQIIVNGILSALDRGDLLLPSAAPFDGQLLH